MIERRIIPFDRDAGDATEPIEVDLTATDGRGWEYARIQLEATQTALSAAVYTVEFALDRGDYRSPPDLPAITLTASNRLSEEVDVRSLAWLRISLTTPEASSTVGVRLTVLLYRETRG